MRKAICLLVCCLMLSCIPQFVKAQVTANFTSNIVSGCSPILVQFTDMSTGGATSWSWNLGNGTTSPLQNPSTTYITAGTYTVTLTASNSSGSDTKTMVAYITVVPSPVVNFAASDTIGSCAPTTIQFTNLTALNATGTATYLWDFGDGFTSALENPSHTYTATGNYSVTLSVTNSAGCSKLITKTNYIHIVAKPTANFSAPVTGSCTVPLTVNFSNSSSGATSYLWDLGNGNTSTAVNPTGIYNATGSYNVTLIAANGNCKDTLTLPSFVSIGSLQAAFTTSTTTTCTGNPVTFTNTSLPGPGNSTWYFGDGTSSNTTNATHAYSVQGTYTVSLVVNYNNCVDTATQTITVNQGPVVQFTANNTLSCSAPFTVQFSNTTTGATSYLWDFGDGTTSTATAPSHTYSALGSYTVTLTATAPNGCVNTLTMPAYIVIYQPTMTISANPPSGCAPAAITFTANISPTVGVTNYTWDFGDGTTSVGGASITHTYNTPGSYTVSVSYTVAQGCSYVSSPITVNIGVKPTASFTGAPLNICPNGTVTFTNTSTGPVGTVYTWYFGDGSTSNNANPTHAYGAQGTYTVTLVATSGGCSDTLVIPNMVVVNPPEANFTPVYDCSNRLKIDFLDVSQGASIWAWDFGDGTTSSQQNPSHVFPAYGSYTVTLTVTHMPSGCQSVKVLNILLYEMIPNFYADTLVCKGEGVTFNGFSNAAAMPYITSADWYFGDGTSALSTGLSPTHTYTASGVYTVMLVVKDSRNCKDTITKTNYITVGGPTAAFVGTPLTGCAPLNVVFTDQTISVAGFASRTWRFGDGTSVTSPLSTSNHTYTYNGTFSVSLIVTDTLGCKDSLLKPAYVVAEKPTASFTTVDTFICPGNLVHFSNVTATGMTYAWDFGDGTTGSTANPNHAYGSSGLYTVRLIVTSANGCKDTLVRNNYINVQGMNLGFTASDSFATCPPLTVTFTNTSVGVGSYLWIFGNGNTSSTASPTTIFSVPGTYTVKLVGQNGSGCVDTAYKTIIVLGPTGTLSYSPTNGCLPLTVNFSSTNQNTSSLIWDLDNGFTQTTTASTYSYTYTQPGLYVPRLLLSDGVSCIVPIFGIDTIRVDKVTSDFTFSPDSQCKAGNVNFMSNIIFAVNPITSYNWDFGDGGTGTGQNTSHYYNTAGSFTVRMIATSSMGCKDTVYHSVTIKPAPTVSAGLPQSLCQGQTLSAQLQASGASTYSWSPAGGLSCANCSNPIASPSVTTTYTVIGTAANGCLDTSDVTVTVRPLPNVTTGNNVDICIGSSVQLASAGAVTYSWSPATGLSCTNCQSPTASPSTTTTYTVTGVDSFGCFDTAMVTVNIVSLPTVTIAGSNNLCIGGGTQLTATGGVTYSWTPATGLSCTTCANPIATPTTTTTYTVTGTVGTGCSNTDTQTIVVHPLPVVSAGANQAVCQGTTAPLQATGAATYTWTPVTGLSCVNCPNPNANINTTTTYKVVGTSIYGCVDSSSVTVTVHPTPNVTTGANVSICAGSSIQLASAGGATYVWSPATGLSCTNCQTPTASPATTTTYTVTGTDAFGCVDTAQVTVTVVPLPNVSVTGGAAFCAGGSTQLQASGATTYQWTPTTGLSCTTCANPTATPTVTTTYIVTGMVNNGCNDTAQVTVTVHPLPNVSGGNNQSICIGSTAQLQASGAATYIWSPSSGLSCTACPNPIANITTTSTYTVVGTDGFGCVDSAQVTIAVNPLPTINAGTDKTICLGVATQLQASGGTTYTWTPTVGLSCTNCNNPFASPPSTTTYVVNGTDANGCSGVDTVIVNVNPLPTVTAGPDVAICKLATTQLSVTGNASSYIWSPAVGLSCTSCTNPVASPTATTTYTVTGTDGNGCSNTDNVVVTIHPQPIIDAGADQSICHGANIQLNATGGVTYTWTPTATLSCSACPNPTASPTSTTTYSVVGVDANGCSDSDKVTISVIQMQPITYGKGDTLCEGESTKLFVSGGDQYLWIPSAGLDDNTSSTPNASPTKTTTYTVIVRQGNCFSDTGYILVVVNPLPTVNAGSDQTILAGTPVNLIATATHTTNYLWAPPDELSCPTCQSTTVTPSRTTTYTVYVSNQFGCKAQDEVTISVRCDNSIVFMANTFTPNGDGANDRFYPQGKGVTVIKRFRVFNRWGELMYDATDIPPNQEAYGWDGTYKSEPLKPDVFVYLVEATCVTGEPILLKGDVSLVR